MRETSPIELKESITRVLWYFYYFRHPLTVEEIHQYLDVRSSVNEVLQQLVNCVQEGRVFSKQNYFGLKEEHLNLRIEAEQLNSKWLNIARRMSKLIQSFPFVRSVFVSGSLSKSGLRGKEDDIDYFLITSPNRIWTAKFFLMIFKKAFLFNSKKYFCINLLRDEKHLRFAKDNVYIATEIVSLKPMTSRDHFDILKTENNWITKYFPNAEPLMTNAGMTSELTVFERILNTFLGDKFEEWCRNLFVQHVEKQQNLRNAHFETSAHSSAYFPDSMESKILSHYNSKPLTV